MDVRRSGPTALLALGLVAAIGVIALTLRLYDIGDKSIWLDEAWSWRAARLPLGDMVDWTAQDRHPPLYYGVLHFWTDLFGDREVGLRSLSAVAGAGSAAVLAVVGWRTGRWPLSLVAGGLFAVHPTAIEFAQEARMYPLAGLLALLATVALASLIDRPSFARAALYAVVMSTATYTHYSAFLLIAVHAVLIVAYAAARRRSDGRRIAVVAAAAFAVVALAYIPWYGHLADHARDGVGHLPDASWALADLVFSSMLGLQWASGAWLAVAIPLLSLAAWGIWKRASDPYVTCVAAIAVVPCMQLFVTIVRTPVLDPRQASPYIAGFVFILAIGLIELGAYVGDILSRRSPRVPVALAGGAAVAAVMLLGARDWYDRGSREDWRAVAREVDAVPGPAYVWRGYVAEPLRFYTRHETRTAEFTPFPPPGAATLVFSHETEEERVRIRRDAGIMYFVGQPVTYEGIVVFPLTPFE